MARVRPLALALATLMSGTALAQDAPRLYAQGYDALQEERLDEAEALLSRCVVQEPSYAECWWGLGWVSWRRDQVDQTVRLWEQVERISPGHPHVVRWLPKARERMAALQAPAPAPAEAFPLVAPQQAQALAPQPVQAPAPQPVQAPVPQPVLTAAPQPHQVVQAVPPASEPQQVATPAPQPQVAHVAPAPQPQVVHVAPAPQPQVAHVAPAPQPQVAPTPQLQAQATPPAPAQQPQVAYAPPSPQPQYAPPAPQPQYAPPAAQPQPQYAPPAPQPQIAYAPAVQPPQVAQAEPAPVAPPVAAPQHVAPAQPQVATVINRPAAPPQGADASRPKVVTPVLDQGDAAAATPQVWTQAPVTATVTAPQPTPVPATTAAVAPPGPRFDWSGKWQFGECWTTAAGFDACIDHAVRLFDRDGQLYAEYDADGYQTMTRFLCKVELRGDELVLVHAEDRSGNVFAGNPGELVVTLHRSGEVVEARLPGESADKLLARRR